MEEKSQQDLSFFSFLNEARGRADGGEIRGAGGIGGERVTGSREEITAEADSTFDVNFNSSRPHHSLQRKANLNIRKLRNNTSEDDLQYHQTRDLNFSRANRRTFSVSDDRNEERNEQEDEQVEEEEGGRSSRNRKMLLRDWLLKQANDNSIRGLRWIGEEEGEKLLRIPWVHESKASWTPDDSAVFEEWAKHTGKFWSSPKDHKRWKSNFRCAINSLPDVKEVRSRSRKTGLEPFKVYRFLPEQPRNQHRKTMPHVGEKRRRRRATDEGRVVHLSPMIITTTTSSYSTNAAASSSCSLPLCSSQIIKKEDSSDEEKEDERERNGHSSSSSISILPACNAAHPLFPPSPYTSHPHPPFSVVRGSPYPFEEEGPHHHDNNTSHLVPTTVAEMSLDSDDNEERKGGAQVNSSTINTELNVTIKEESSSSSTDSSSYSSSSSSNTHSPLASFVPMSILPLTFVPDFTEMNATEIDEILQSMNLPTLPVDGCDGLYLSSDDLFYL